MISFCIRAGPASEDGGTTSSTARTLVGKRVDFRHFGGDTWLLTSPDLHRTCLPGGFCRIHVPRFQRQFLEVNTTGHPERHALTSILNNRSYHASGITVLLDRTCQVTYDYSNWNTQIELDCCCLGTDSWTGRSLVQKTMGRRLDMAYCDCAFRNRTWWNGPSATPVFLDCNVYRFGVGGRRPRVGCSVV